MFIAITLILTQSLFAQSSAQRVRQPREVVEAYRVCQRFQDLMAKDLDFDRAFEATFTKDAKRRREIAITEGEFGNIDLSSVDDAALVDAFKARMQIFYLMLTLVSPNNKGEEDLFFPPAIKAIVERKPPQAPDEFRSYAVQLKGDAKRFRTHLNELASRDPAVAERIRKFKKELSKKITPPSHIVKPLTAYSRGRVLGLDEKYYQIGEYAVIREGRAMRIIGIRFFSRLF
jgi:hypothetical protein